ncbi:MULTISPECIES: carbohydrate ABC transporter permease [Nesterenkonia]|uniref:N,N'-diacetylchitobiose transport system permease protein n=1 Tax=Nesterenkonia xinjiangensis TaxID=225327 RepID=A0A7Z0GM92_9MICC|nr:MULTISPECIES: carbohydrate ABC transporter permease [Nesterenkonia]MDZ5078273.1 carbohydrate ABC transporter permease [Nesterenkonia sp. HG001]NYJ78114.1 N,N'-diacetylchitobiose transport system permease protein [Nesterenkonia xinjiangensis]
MSPTTTPMRPRRAGGRLALNIVAGALALVWIFPIYWMVNVSLQPNAQMRLDGPTWLPFSFTPDAYLGVLQDSSFWTALQMSLQVSLLAVAVALCSATLAAVALSRFRFRSRTAIVVTVLIVQMIPAEALFISQFRMLSNWGLVNTALGLSLLYVGTVMPFIVWMLKGFVDGVPVDLEEAAMIDGCTKVGAFFRVTFPLLGPGLVATGVFGFLVSWNEFTLALVILSSGGRVTLPVWLQGFQEGMTGTDWAGVMAGSALIAVPVLILFCLVQRRMASGMVAGAVKG